MNNNDLSNLYRRLVSAEAAPALLSAEDLAAVADGSVAADRRDEIARSLAASPAQAALARMLCELNSESESLAADVARTTRETHRRRQPERRVAAGRRLGHASRWTALAACLVAVIGAWSLRQRLAEPHHAGSRTQAVARADTIFNSRDQIFGENMERDHSKGKSQAAGDRVFHGDFSGG